MGFCTFRCTKMESKKKTTSSRWGPRCHAAFITALGPSYMLALPSRPHGILVSARRGASIWFCILLSVPGMPGMRTSTRWRPPHNLPRWAQSHGTVWLQARRSSLCRHRFSLFIDHHRFALRIEGVISCALCDACTRRVRDPKSKAVPLAASCPSPPFLTFLFSFPLENESYRCVTTDTCQLVKLPRSNSPSAHFPSTGVNADGQVPHWQLAWFTEVRYVLELRLAAKQSAPFVASALASVSVYMSTCRLWQYCSRTWNTHRVRIHHDIRTSDNTEDTKMYEVLPVGDTESPT